MSSKVNSDVKQAVIKELCLNSYKFFARYFFKVIYGQSFILNSHHEAMCDELQACVEGKLYEDGYDGLIINIPPRYSKTELGIILLAPWVIAHNRKAQFMHLSYAQDLVYLNSDMARQIVESPEYQALFPTEIDKSHSAKKAWRTVDKGAFYAASTGGQVTGFGAGMTAGGKYQGFIQIDDPIKPEDADSDLVRNKINARFNSTFKSRKNHRSTPIIITMQRIHDMDMSGYLLEGHAGLKFKHLKMPVISDGKPLWPLKHDLDEIKAMQEADKYVFSSQYMQNPVPDDGIMFKRDKARFYKTLPAKLNYYGASDYAVTEDAGDYTEHGVFALDEHDNIYIIDWWSGQTTADVWIEQQIDFMAKYKAFTWGGETGPIKSSIEPFLLRRMRERKTYAHLEWVSHSANNKTGNARSFQALWEHGRVYLPEDKPWATELLHQLTRFPRGTYDDKVDVCSIFARYIQKTWNAEKTKLPPEQPKISGNQEFKVSDFFSDGQDY